MCGTKHESNEILIHKKLKDIPEDKRITGYELCPEHQKLHEDGYIALVVAKRYSTDGRTRMKLGEGDRTGEIVHMKRAVFSKLFDVDEEVASLEMIYIDEEVLGKIKAMQQ